jgi:hypothetical protein
MLDASAHAMPRPVGLAGWRPRHRAEPSELRKPLRFPVPVKKGRHSLGASAALVDVTSAPRPGSVETHGDAAAIEDATLEDTTLEDATSGSPIRRWLGRSGVLGGGAVSLAIGAVLGGVLEGVPHLLAPPPAAGAFPVAGPGVGTLDGSGHLSAQLAASRSAAPDWQGLVNNLLPVTSIGLFPGTAPASALPGSSTPGGTVPVRGPVVGGAGGPVGGGGSSGSGPGSGVGSPSSPPSPPSCDASCALLNTVTQTFGQVPGAGAPLSGVVSQVGTTASGVASAAGAAGGGLVLPGGSTAPNVGSGTVSTLPSSNVTPTLPGALSGLGGAFGL